MKGRARESYEQGNPTITNLDKEEPAKGKFLIVYFTALFPSTRLAIKKDFTQLVL